MRIVSCTFEKRDDFDPIFVNGWALPSVAKHCGEGELHFEEHEYKKILKLTEEPSVISLDEHRTLTGFFITNFQHAWVNEEFVGTAEFRFTNVGDRLDFL